MKMKRLTATLLTGVMAFTLSTSALALNTETPQSQSATKQFVDGLSRAGIGEYGEGQLNSTNLPGFKPYATAVTTYYYGLANMIYAGLTVTGTDGSSGSTDSGELQNQPEAKTAKLTSKTEDCSFRSTHKIRQTSSSQVAVIYNDITWPKS